MKLEDVQRFLNAEVLCGKQYLSREVTAACGADLMSDVLAHTIEKALLLTGLANSQTVRTAEVIDLAGIVFVRGKRPTAEVVELAVRRGIPLLITAYPMYEACGILYKHGLSGCSEVEN